MEIIPIGTEKYRTKVLKDRRTGPNAKEIDAKIHIAKEGEVTRILGGWIGNGIEDENILSKVLDKIADYFEHWSRGNPTIFGWWLTAQMFRGGISQYLTTVQGMPKSIESTLQKMINKFMWDSKQPSINQQILGMPIHDGGI